MIKVLVVDDSFLMRKLLSDILSQDPDIEVIGKAKNGEDALQKFKELQPDVVTLDLEMPGIFGLDVLYEIMRTKPTPVIIISAYAKQNATETLQALEYGAVDFVTKPSGPISVDLQKIREQLIELVKTTATIDPKKLHLKRPAKVITAPLLSQKVVVIGASSGGPPAIQALLSSLPKNFPAPLLVVQHMPKGFTGYFAKRLKHVCNIKVKEAQKGDLLEPGMVFVAPGGYHVKVKNRGKDLVIHLNTEPPVNNIRPSIDVTMESVAQCCKENAIGIILTGMGHDGLKGMLMIKKMGGTTIAQDESTSFIYGMPKAVAEHHAADVILPLREISKQLVALL